MDRLYACILVAAVCTIFLWVRSKRAKYYGSLPPSPTSDPLIGNMRSMMNMVDEPRAYRDWGLELRSDIISITLPGKVIIVLNSHEAADELLSKRASVYSDRPYIPMIASDSLTGWGNNTAILEYGERWRFQRRVTHEAFHKAASAARWPLLERQVRLALQRIMADPNNFSLDIRRMAGSTILMAVYGYDVTSAEDRLFKAVETAVEGFSQALVVSNYLVNTFHWLECVPKWFPGTNWKVKADVWRHQLDRMLHVPFEWTKSKMASLSADSGTFASCLLSEWLTKYKSQDSDLPSGEIADRIRWAAATMFAAGTDTSVSTIRTFIMAMAIHQDIQAKVQAEIDNAIGTRLPEMADWESMPYVRCIVKEVLRWRSALPLAIPHACIQEDTYKGYRIPKGAIVIGNTWAMSNDPSVYSEPDRFNPDRFLDPSVPDAPAFGFGRRICPGSHHAEAILFITAASMLSMFNIRPEVDTTGNPIPLKADMGLNEALRSFLSDVKLLHDLNNTNELFGNG
ncbi:unnamed protein product [Rhizoctonia solani]|uniref:O-methylsterigmatocystin oxidoreductase n=1 Tax=Rhizoctonia solani TaxID=456999 RepID=A0A8H3DXD4_9AGAM|nr:unnamed protein product [Rhizoctonia solani]